MCAVYLYLLCFCKQKTAYEMRISDWSSDVCSSDLSAGEAIDYFRGAGYLMLDVTAAHAAAVEDLPRLHADPFDRLIVTQALTEPLRLVTRDRRLAAYSDTVICW